VSYRQRAIAQKKVSASGYDNRSNRRAPWAFLPVRPADPARISTHSSSPDDEVCPAAWIDQSRRSARYERRVAKAPRLKPRRLRRQGRHRKSLITSWGLCMSRRDHQFPRRVADFKTCVKSLFLLLGGVQPKKVRRRRSTLRPGADAACRPQVSPLPSARSAPGEGRHCVFLQLAHRAPN
jgi:hypothetical protein